MTMLKLHNKVQKSTKRKNLVSKFDTLHAVAASK